MENKEKSRIEKAREWYFETGLTEKEYLKFKKKSVLTAGSRLFAKENLKIEEYNYKKMRIEMQRMKIFIKIYKSLPSEVKPVWLKKYDKSDSDKSDSDLDGIIKDLKKEIKKEGK